MNMDNIVLTKHLDLIVLNAFTQKQLNEYSELLGEAIVGLNQLMDNFNHQGDTDMVTDLRVNLTYALSNKAKIDSLILNNESELFVFGEFANYCLN